jgi:O-antigen/teichoic acid export membrane protein
VHPDCRRFKRLQFALSPFTSVFAATQRFDLANLIGVVTFFLTAAGIVFTLRSDYGLIGVSMATCAGSLIDYYIRWYAARRLASGIELSRRRVSLARLKEISAFGAWNFLISLNAFIYQHVPNILIGAFLPIVAVGRYALSVGLVRQINSSLGPVGQVIYPAAAALDVKGDDSGLERLYHDGSRLMMLVIIPVTVLAYFWAEDFYRLWVGEAYLSGSAYPSVALVFQVLVLSIATNYSNVAGHILMGAGHVRSLAIAAIRGSLINLPSLISCRCHGLHREFLGYRSGTMSGRRVCDPSRLRCCSWLRSTACVSWDDRRGGSIWPCAARSPQVFVR